MKNRSRFFLPFAIILGFTLIFFIINIESRVNSLNENILMSQNFGGDGDEIIRDVALDQDGNYSKDDLYPPSEHSLDDT